MQSLHKNKFQLLFFGIVVSVLLVLFVIRQLDLRRMEKDGVYVVGYVAKASHAKNGVMYTCYYKYNKASYSAKFTDIRGLQEGDLIFFRISSSKPDAWKDLTIQVPPCIKLDEAPATGWKQLPKCS